MNRLFLLLSLTGFFSCQPKDQPSDIAARASGKYVVQSYIVNGDTLYTTKGVNKIDVSEFYISLDRNKPDSVRVGCVYRKNGELGSITYIRDAGVNEANGIFQLSIPTSTPSLYESRIDGNNFYLRTGLDGLIVVPMSYTIKNPANPTLTGVVVSAQR